MPPVGFCNDVFLEHAIEPSAPWQDPPKHLLPGGHAPFGTPPAELHQARGHLACLTASTPAVSDRSPRRIYPDLTHPDTLCHETVLTRVWNSHSSQRPCGSGPLFERSRREPQAFARRLLKGPSFVPSRESEHERPHPGCLPPWRLPKGKRRYLTCRVSGQVRHPTPFLPSPTRVLTRTRAIPARQSRSLVGS